MPKTETARPKPSVSYEVAKRFPLEGCENVFLEVTVSSHPIPRFSYQTFRLLVRSDSTGYRLPFLPITTVAVEGDQAAIGRELKAHILALTAAHTWLTTEPRHKDSGEPRPAEQPRRPAKSARQAARRATKAGE